MNTCSCRRLGNWMLLLVLMGSICGCQSRQLARGQVTNDNAELQRQNSNLNRKLSDIRAELRETKGDTLLKIDDMGNLFAAAKRAKKLTKRLAILERKAHASEAKAGKAQAAAAKAHEDANEARMDADKAMSDAKWARAEADKARTGANAALAELRHENDQLKVRVATSELVQVQQQARSSLRETIEP